MNDPHPSETAARFERVGRFIYAFHRTGIAVDELTGADFVRTAPPALVARAGALAERYHAIVREHAGTDDATIAAVVAEAAAVAAAVAAWRGTHPQP